MRRAIRIVRKDGTTTDLELAKATRINADLGMLHIDKIKDGWRLIFTEEVAKDFSQVERLEIIRED